MTSGFPTIFENLDGCPAQFAKSLRIVGIILPGHSVYTFAVKILGVFQKVVAYTARIGGFGNSRESQRIAKRDGSRLSVYSRRTWNPSRGSAE